MKKLLGLILSILLLFVITGDVSSAMAPPRVYFGNLNGVIRNIENFSEINYRITYTETDMVEINSEYYVSYYTVNNDRYRKERGRGSDLKISLQPRSGDFFQIMYLSITRMGEGELLNIKKPQTAYNNNNTFSIIGEETAMWVSFYTLDNYKVTLQQASDVLSVILPMFGKVLERDN